MRYSEIIAMVIDSIFFSIVLTSLSIVVIYFYKKYRQEKIRNLLQSSVFLVYIYMLLYVTVFRGGLFRNATHTINAIPFDELLSSSYYQMAVLGKGSALLMVTYNVLGNIIWFIPLGFLVPILCNKMTLVKIILTSAGVSLAIEVLQYIFYTGVSDIDDIIFNVIGGVCGYLMYLYGKAKIERSAHGHNN